MEFKHFSHPHHLRIYQVDQRDKLHCSGCESICSGSVYGCLHCRFCLHEQCAKASRSMEHPSHPLHHLTLIPCTTHNDGIFLCNACGATGSAFSFCCAACDFDLHVHCASLPQSVQHEAQPHKLSLTYALPDNYQASSPHSCGICHKLLDSKYWTYNCSGCTFHVHTSCATMKTHGAYQTDNVIGGAPPGMAPYLFHTQAQPSPAPFGIHTQAQPSPAPFGRLILRPASRSYNAQIARMDLSAFQLGFIG